MERQVGAGCSTCEEADDDTARTWRVLGDQIYMGLRYLYTQCPNCGSQYMVIDADENGILLED